MVAFTYRKIQIIVSGTANLMLHDLRTTCRINQIAAPGLGTADVLIYGLSLSDINQLTTYAKGEPYGVPSNEITIMAGDDVNGMSLVFAGYVWLAYPEMMNAPLGPFHIIAMSGRVAPHKDTNVDGPTDAVQLIQKLATDSGWGFEDVRTVQSAAMLYSPKHQGDAWTQIKELASALGLGVSIENKIVRLLDPKGGSGTGMTVSPGNGLVGYPAFTEEGVLLKTEYTRPLWISQIITVTGSQLSLANGDWKILHLNYDLECEMPRGHWFLWIVADKPEGTTPAPPMDP